MTPKEKAEELLCKFSIFPDGNNDIVKECAIICAKEMIDIYESRAILTAMIEIHRRWNISWWTDVIEEIKKYK